MIRTSSLNERRVLLCASFLIAAALLALRWPQELQSLRSQKASLISKLDTAFIENTGQLREDIRFWNRTALGDSYLLADGRLMHALPVQPSHPGKKTREIWVLVESLSGGSHATITARGQRSVGMTEFDGQISEAMQLRSYDQVEIKNAWEGIDLALANSATGIERIYMVHAFAAPDHIRVSLDGATELAIERDGTLRVSTGAGALHYREPVAYQLDQHGTRRSVKIQYRIEKDAHSFGFDVGPYDTSQTLVIDPVLQGTYFGGAGSDNLRALAVDPQTGEILVAGTWESGSAPASVGGFQEQPQTQSAVIARFDRKLEHLIQSTLFGGSFDEEVTALAIDPTSGDVFLAGSTDSPDLPGSGSGIEPTIAFGNYDGYLARFSANLRSLQAMTYFGGARDSSIPRGMAINPTNNELYVTGDGVGGAVLVRYDTRLAHILSRTALEGNYSAVGYGVAFNPATQDVYMVGATGSSVFPKLSGGAFPVGTGGIFVARFDESLATHFQTTFVLDGNLSSQFHVPIVVDPKSGDVIVAASSEHNASVLAAGAQTTFGGGNRDAVVVRFSADLRQMRGSTYFGGEGDEYAFGLALSKDNDDVYLAGNTDSISLPAPNEGAGQSQHPYIVRLSPLLDTIKSIALYQNAGLYLMSCNGVVVHPSTGEVYITGATNGDLLPAVAGGAQPDFMFSTMAAPTYESYVARFDALLSNDADAIPDAFSFAAQSGVALGSVVTSAATRIYGFTQDIPISVSNGEYSIDGAQFTSANGTLMRGQSVRVRHTASTNAGMIVRTVLTAGGVAGEFVSTAQSGSDTNPDAFSFATPPREPRSHSITSNSVVITGINAPAAVSILGGEYSIDAGPFIAVPGKINGGQSIRVRHTTAADLATETTSTVTIGALSVNFRSLTDEPDTTPNNFKFSTHLGVPANSDVSSNILSVTGINTATPISISGGTFKTYGPTGEQINPSTVNNLESVIVTLHTGDAGSTSTATLTIGGVSGTFSASVPAPVPANGVPDQFSFPTVTGAEPNVWVESAPVMLTGFTVPTPIEIVGAVGTQSSAYFVPEWGAFAHGGPGSSVHAATFSPGQPLRVRLMAQSYGTTNSITINVGGTTGTFTVITRVNDAKPDAFDFADHLGVTPGATVNTETLVISGIDSPVALNTNGCLASINTSPTYTSQATIRNGDSVSLQVIAPIAAGSSATCTIDVGEASDTFKVITSGVAGSNTSNGEKSKGGGGEFDWLELIAFGALSFARRLKKNSGSHIAQV